MKRRSTNRGAVIVEFALAFLPIAAIFTVLMEVGRLSIARIAMQHSASVSVRACSVIQNPRPEDADGNGLDGNELDIQRAGEMAVKPWIESNTLSDVAVDCPPG